VPLYLAFFVPRRGISTVTSGAGMIAEGSGFVDPGRGQMTTEKSVYLPVEGLAEH
jgi:hypothetical protein